ncbi:uncharacterized protein LOC127261269 [Andrographis paniculata]|uniref:uncharacterized protein LOC127261269 n=1 Tax=Andrographis paniculata TaxID=175694 RepID=UPI0021E6F808|nr:uncharacterized protein LOC127261269 [Andrographis paniculata]XP_051145497.1 uncharacterized protein LOC127261269 [Andrographis paniculata]XP_051145499.1 uncharacterized protein LOC127261269 [Andrographis paniculata]XP_051145500.1 uncharacterized protein LOC127261269 [Andrographis paniculata]
MLFMKGNQRKMFDDSKNVRNETDPLAVESEINNMNEFRRNNHPSEFEVNDRDKFSILKFENGSEAEHQDSRLPYITASDSLKTEANILECELPDLQTCCKVRNDNTVKDEYIEKGMPVLNQSIKDDRSVNMTSKASVDATFVDGKSSIQEERQASHLLYNNKVESGGSISFRNQIVESADVLEHKANAKQVQWNNNEVSIIGGIHEPILNIKDGFPIGLSATSNTQCVSGKDTIHANDCNKPHAEHRDSGNESMMIQGKYDLGEPNSSAASDIAYSGPIAFSRSLSIRSDSSAATSGRSFAFPILQSEWNSSPARMTKADDRHLHKHKGWRAGLLCCRF